MSELYGIQYVGLVQIQRPDQASKNLASHILALKECMVYTPPDLTMVSHASIKQEHLCFTAHIVYFSLRKDGCIILAKSILCLCFVIEIS